MKRKIVVLITAALLVSSLGSCGHKGGSADLASLINYKPAESSMEETTEEPSYEEPDISYEEPSYEKPEIRQDGKILAWNDVDIVRAFPDSFDNPGIVNVSNTYLPKNYTASVPAYSIAADLSNIENIGNFSNLNEKQRNMIASNGFVVMPTDEEQLFYIYESNLYNKVPNFISTDSVLQLYHLYFDYALRDTENEYFFYDTIKMNMYMIVDLMDQYDSVTDADVKEAYKRAIAYFCTANYCLGIELPEGIDSEIAALAGAEYANIQSYSGTLSAITGEYIDFSIFKPRGHYTRTPELEKYFLAFSLYGNMPLKFHNDTGIDKVKTLTAMIISDTLVQNVAAKEVWDNIYSVTEFMVGESDDISPVELSGIINDLYGYLPVGDDLLTKYDSFTVKIDGLRTPAIAKANAKPELRFMGTRYLPDSDMFTNLTVDIIRPVPTGAEVFAVYGSEQAEKVVNEIYRPQDMWSDYTTNYNLLTQRFRSQSVFERTSNVYNGWLYALSALVTSKGEGYPMFMQNEAWKNKSLTTALASWAELRHDTILYGKQSGAECGGDEEEPPELMAYVEPDPEFFARLYYLVETTYDGLSKRGILSDNIRYKTESLLDEITFLKGIAEKELRGEDLSAEERSSLLYYGGTLEWLSSTMADSSDWYQIENETDRRMGVIADVHSAAPLYLEEAVGNACEIYVAVPQNGKIYLTRGAVFDYYEFCSETRLTDEEWQQKIINKETPDRVPYVDTFMDQDGGEPVPVPDSPFTTGC